MQLTQLVRVLSIWLVLGTLATTLPGCGGGGSQEVGDDGMVEPVPPENPMPGDLEPEVGLE